jgi:hypothetical protein
MTNKSKLIGIAAIVAVGFASPASAQRAYDIGVNAYDMVGPLSRSDYPAASGGGSFGYNDNIRRDQW